MYDIGQHEGVPYIVSELLTGQTLRECLSGGALPVRKAVEYSVQVAHGLAGAHEKGIAHRDLKPENIFVTNDGALKILDFVLAKLTEREPAVAGARALPTTPPNTLPGVVLGTIGYMSPEQVRGEPADHRTDIFGLGLILYEMLSGRRAFSAETPIETMHAILKLDPPELATTGSGVPSALERIVRYCLEKNPNDRFQSAPDVGLALETVSGQSTSSAQLPAVPANRWLRRMALAAALLAIGVALFAAGRFSLSQVAPATTGASASTPPKFHRLTFRRGWIQSARFAPDGQTVLYGAEWDGQPVQQFLVRLDSTESRPLGLQADLHAISRSGEMTIAVRPRSLLGNYQRVGTLARVPLRGEHQETAAPCTSSSPGSFPLTCSRSTSRRGVALFGKELAPADRTGVNGILSIRITPDGRSYAYSYYQVLSDLFVVEGLK